jgi:hypothetical protein
MTTGTGAMTHRPGSRVTERLAGPRQGWSSLMLLLVMLAITGLAIDEQRWMGIGPDGTSQTAMLPLLMVAAGITGTILASSRLSAGWVDLVAALIGTGAGLLFASGAVSDAPSLAVRLEALNESLARFLHDVLVSGTRTEESSAFLLTVSALAWTSGVFAAISIFRRSNAAGAIAPIGAMLLLQLLVSGRPQDIWLVLFAGASLLLVLRLDLESQRDGWLRRRIGGGQGVGGLFLRGGAGVIACMLIGSLALSNVAGTASVAAAFPQLEALVDDLASRVQGMVGVTTQSARGTNGEFPANRPIKASWRPTDEVAFIAEPLLGDRHYWRGASWDAYDGHIWRRTGSVKQDVPTGDDLLADSEDAVSEGSSDHRTVIATITSMTLRGSHLPVPQNPVLLDRDARVSLMGDGGTFEFVEAMEILPVRGQYTVTGMEPAINEPDGGLTINRLVSAGTEYPEWVEPFRTITASSAGPATIQAAADLRAALPKNAQDPYRLAKAVQDFLREGPGFRYAVDTACEPGQTVSDCLLITQVGFCQQYATTMAAMLRQLKVPARYVEGFLPGRDIGDGQFQVDMSAGHAWVEVWFPEVGWIPFDPTPGNPTLVDNGQQPTALELGAPIPTPGPSDDAGPDPSDGSFDPNATEEPTETAEPEASPDAGAGGGLGGDSGGGGALLLLGLGGLMAASVALAAAFLWLRRFPGRDPELAWRGIVGLATQLGAGPQPSQTPYEYTATLSRVVPTAARDLRVVADAKVDASYSPRVTGEAAVRPLRDAYRRARRGLLRLVFRRKR